MLEAAIRPVGPGEAEHVPGAPWKCVLMFALHFLPAFLELVLEVVLNGVLLRNKKESMSFFWPSKVISAHFHHTIIA